MLSPSSALPPPSLLLSLLANYSGSNERPPFPVENDLDRIFGRRLPRLMPPPPPPPPPQRSREREPRDMCCCVLFPIKQRSGDYADDAEEDEEGKMPQQRNILTRLPHYSLLPLFHPIPPRDEMRRNRYPSSNVWQWKNQVIPPSLVIPRSESMF